MRLRSRSIAVPLLALVLGAAGAWLARAASSPAAIEARPPNPVAGQTVLLRETSPDAPDAAPVPGAWWDFGDGHSSASGAPVHVWEAPGEYVVRLVSSAGTSEAPLVVSPAETLRLLGAHPFEVSVEAVDPRTGRRSAARASAWTDRYGTFSFPELTADPENPEIAVKALEATEDGHYWFLWSGATRFEYIVTIREMATGRVAVHRKEGPEFSGGSDTRSFPLGAARRTADQTGPSNPRDVLDGPERPSPRAVGPRGTPATPTPTQVPNGTTTTPPSATPTRTPVLTRTPTRTSPPTWTPTASPTPTSTPTPTITPTPTPPLIALRAIQWQWNFCPQPYPCPTVCPTSCGNQITLKVGQTYLIWPYNGDVEDVQDVHGLQTIVQIGLNGGLLPQGGSLPIQTITPMTPGDFFFNCTNVCGNSEEHDGMVGVVHVVP